jgi:hypothetical protein
MPLLFLCPPPAALGRLKRAATTTPNPYPFCFCFFSFAFGQGPGQAARRPLRPCRGARDGWPGPGRGSVGGWCGGKWRAVCNTADHGGPPGRVQARRSARASVTSAGERPDPLGQGERGRGRERPRLSWDGGAAKPLPYRSLCGGALSKRRRSGNDAGILWAGMTGGPMLHRGDVMPGGGGAGPMQAM